MKKKKKITMIDEYKKNPPSLKMCYLLLLTPIIILATYSPYLEEDIWFLIKHGEYVLNHGIPHIEFLSMHEGLHFVMQQWLSSIIFYLTHQFLGSIGLKLLLEIVNVGALYFLYKLCLLVSNNKYRLSIYVTVITDIVLIYFWISRPWIFTFFNIIIVLYIMELFYRKNNIKILLFLPLLSLLQINIQAAMWLLLIVFMLPYIVDLIIKKEKRVIYLLGIIILMLLVGFINPYGLESMLYVFNSYGHEEIDYAVMEMHAPVIGLSKGNMPSNMLFISVLGIIMTYILGKKGKLKLRYFFLTIGTLMLALLNVRSIPLFIIGSFFQLADYLSPYGKNNKLVNEQDDKGFVKSIVILMITILVLTCFVKTKETNILKKGVDAIIKDGATSKDPIFTKYEHGPYAEYRGLKPYMDTRAEVFIKENNHKEDIFYEYMQVEQGVCNYNKFLNKYNFKYLIILKNEYLYMIVITNPNYEILYDNKYYTVFKKKEKS